MLYKFDGNIAEIYGDVFIAPGVRIIGDVNLADKSSIWYNAVIRGDVAGVKIGSRTNIQDNCTLHVDTDIPLLIGNDVTVGHGAIIHGCTIEDNCLIGMGAVILNQAHIGKNCIIGAGALVPENKEIPAGSLVVGIPSKIARQVRQEEIEANRKSVRHYYQLAQKHMDNLKNNE